MKPRERILKTIKREIKADNRVPVALLSGGTWTFRQRGRTLKEALEQPDVAAQMISEVNQTVQSAIVWPGSGYHNILVHIFGGKINFRPKGNIDVQQPVIDHIAAIDRIAIDRMNQHEWIAAIRSMINAVDRMVGHQWLVGTSSWGPFTLAGQFYGVERLMKGLYKDEQGIRALLECMTEICFRYLAPAIKNGAVMLSIAEPTASGDLLSLKHFEEFVAPYLSRLIEKLKAQKSVVTLHICGNIKDRLHLAPELGVDLLSVDYKVDLQHAQQILQGKIALAGNVNPVLLREGSPTEIRIQAERCLQAAYADNFILMPGCDVPPAVPLENILAFVNTGLEWQNVQIPNCGR